MSFSQPDMGIEQRRASDGPRWFWVRGRWVVHPGQPKANEQTRQHPEHEGRGGGEVYGESPDIHATMVGDAPGVAL